MDIKRKHSLCFTFSLIFSVISSIMLSGAIFVNSDGKNKVLLLISGIAFWVALLLEQIFFWWANHLMKKSDAKNSRYIRSKPGIFSFGTSIEGIVADAMFVISLVVLLVCTGFGIGEEIAQYIIICLLVLSFRLHCFLNGKNYRYKKVVRKVERENG